jgi:hypothetical protein
MSAAFCEDLKGQLGEMFVCSPVPNGLVRVRTPFWFPDGGVIDLFVREGRSGELVVTDLGESLGWLRTQSTSGKRSPKQDKLIADVCMTLGVELFKGQIVLGSRPEQIGQSVMKVGQAAVRLSDLWFMMRTRAVESVTDEVADLLTERKVVFDRSPKVPGRSGRVWTLDFQIRADGRSSLVAVLSSENRAAGHRAAEHIVAGWHDLSPYRVTTHARFVTLVDDTTDVVQEEDFKLVESASDGVARWSRPDEFVEMLRAA